MNHENRIDLPRPFSQHPAYLIAMGVLLTFVCFLAWEAEGGRRLPAVLAPLSACFVIFAVQRGRFPRALEREGEYLLIHRRKGLRSPFLVERIPVTTATLEWVGSALWLRNLKADGAEAFSPGVLLGCGEGAAAVLPWLRAQGLPEPVGR